jgi:hypothetical protein
MTVWERRDLPVLTALARPEDESVREGFLCGGHGRAREALGLELEDDEIHEALLTLRDAGYVDFDVEYESGPGSIYNHLSVTGRGQQALGQWPLFDTIVSPETLARLLEQLAEEAATDEEAQNMRRAAKYVRTLSGVALRTFAVGAIATAIRGALGLP